MTVIDSMYIQVYKYIPYKLCIYRIYNGAGLYIRYRHIPNDGARKFARHGGLPDWCARTFPRINFYSHFYELLLIMIQACQGTKLGLSNAALGRLKT